MVLGSMAVGSSQGGLLSRIMDSCEEDSDDEDPVACDNTRKQLFSHICSTEELCLLSCDEDRGKDLDKNSAKTPQDINE